MKIFLHLILNIVNANLSQYNKLQVKPKQRRCWQKIIYASDLELEYEQIKDIPKQRIQIQKYEQAKENNPFAEKN